MSVATPKSQAKNPIQLDIIIVCRKNKFKIKKQGLTKILRTAEEKKNHLERSMFSLSENDKKIVKYGQLLTTLRSAKEITSISSILENQTKEKSTQLLLQI